MHRLATIPGNGDPNVSEFIEQPEAPIIFLYWSFFFYI